MGIFKKEKWNWHLKCLDKSDYELTMIFTTKDNFFMKIYKDSVLKLARTKGIHTPNKMDDIEEFMLDPQYLNATRFYVRKPFNITKTDILNQKGILLMTYAVHEGRYVKDGDVWRVFIKVKGIYSKK